MTHTTSGTLYSTLQEGLPLNPSVRMPDGRSSRGWTLRPDRLNASAMRFDWIHGAPFGSDPHPQDPADRQGLRDDVLNAAARVARDAGYRVKSDGLGLLIVARRISQ